MTIFKNLSTSGLVDSDDYQIKRGIVLSNYISIGLCAAMVILFINRLLFFDNLLLDKLGVGLVLFTIPVVCNRFYLTTLSRLLLCFVPVLYIWYVFVTFMLETGSIDQSAYISMRIFLLSVSFTPYLLFDKSRPIILLVGILPTLISVLFSDFILRSADLIQQPVGLVSDDYLLLPIRTFVAYTIISFGCFMFQSIISKNDHLNKTLIADLKIRSEEIETQNDQLIQGQAKLNEINRQLECIVEEKVRDIRRQHEVLIKYSYTNAHHVRGPLARILGLIQLSKIETDLNYPWFFEKVESEAIQIDEMISRISKDLDETGVVPGKNES